MEDQFIIKDEIDNELKDIENLTNNLARNLALLSQKIRYIISKIKNASSIEQTTDYFEILDKIISTLNHIVYNEKIGIPNRLSQFMRDFDNVHENKEFYFLKIQSNEYSF